MAAGSGPPGLLHVFWDERMLTHDPGCGVFDLVGDPGFLDVLEPHPENAARLRNMVSVLRRGPLAPRVAWRAGRRAAPEELYSFHTPEYIRSLEAAAAAGGSHKLCAGTWLNPGSWEAALVAAGTAMSAMASVLEGGEDGGRAALALVRPPGHHAQPGRADGYCFLNNAALAVQLALAPGGGCERVAVIDIDVHYGNGTAEGFYESGRVLTISLHMDHGSWGPSHPQSLQADQVGARKGVGLNLNVPLPNGTGDEGYMLAMEELVLPAVAEFRPDVLVFCVGQDSSQFDPNGRMCLTMGGYRRLGRAARQVAAAHCAGRVLVVQEGGYQPTYSAYCLHATLEGVLGLEAPLLEDPIAYYPEDVAPAVARVAEIRRVRDVAIAEGQAAAAAAQG